MKSKLRYNLQELNCVNLSLVKGKSGFRLVGIKGIVAYSGIYGSLEKTSVIGNIFLLILRLVDEGKDVALYDGLHSAVTFLNNEEFSLDELKLFETIYSLILLDGLGYVKDGVLDIILFDTWTKELLENNNNNLVYLLDNLSEVLSGI